MTSKSTKYTELFLNKLADDERLKFSELVKIGGLEGILWEFVKSAETEWPNLSLESEYFMEMIAEKFAQIDEKDVEKAFSEFRAADFYLACACATGDERAIESFDKAFRSEIETVLVSRRLAGNLLEEVKQRLRERFFTHDGEKKPAIMQYSGGGQLRRWVRIAAVRMALDLTRSEKKYVLVEDDLLNVLDRPGENPEDDHFKKHYRDVFKEALHEAIRALSATDLNLLKLSHLDGLHSEQLAEIFRVHRATVSRWLAKVRETIEKTTREKLMEKLNIPTADYQSIMRLIQSQLQASLTRVIMEKKTDDE